MLSRLILGLFAALFVATTAAAQTPARKPLVVILGEPRGTVPADLMNPYAILSESGAVDVRVVSPTRALIRLAPGHAWLAPQLTTAQLERRPDVIILPAMDPAAEDDPARAEWLRAQVKAGARVLVICNGARAFANTGLLDGRQAAVHWFSHDKMVKAHPKVVWRRDRRWITDGPITTTTGISAAEPATLHLLEEIAGRDVMLATAARLRLPPPDPRHRGSDYQLTAKGMAVTVANRAAVWAREDVALPIAPGFDERALGAALDAWSRTYKSEAWVTGAPVTRSRHGLLVYRSQDLPKFDRRVALPAPEVTASVFAQIRKAYGERTARFVALQFEHPWGAVSAW
jgi:putative intracellular protease/amidase